MSPKHLEKLDLDMGFSTTKGYYIGFKVTLVLEKDSLCPISVIIHSGAKNDSKIFDEVLEELNRRRLLKKGQVILFDKGYVRQEASLFSIEFSENRDIFNPCCVGFPPLKLLIQ